ncbi:hypothetical protein [Laspinema olomoucense]|uniref:hypothetical protein n=1 Tax=Laspinema olomoucense TaxID=3231600 RepID=UPI0021BA8F48|nr:hypothetical protein [Laspinema sp. D3b]
MLVVGRNRAGGNRGYPVAGELVENKRSLRRSPESLGSPDKCRDRQLSSKAIASYSRYGSGYYCLQCRVTRC